MKSKMNVLKKLSVVGIAAFMIFNSALENFSGISTDNKVINTVNTKINSAITEDAYGSDDTIILRVCNWEEYIDLGDWDKSETIELENGEEIIGVNPMYEDFEKWYYETYGQKVKVEYSCFGTNEELYSQMNIGDVYDLVCPSDYLIMKLMTEGKLEQFSDDFFDETREENYYIKGVSPFIKNEFESHKINGETWSKYAACYMWGVTGILYNPEYVTKEEASTWSFFRNPKFKRRVTLKDSVRECYFSALCDINKDLLTSEEFINDENYKENLYNVVNDVSPEAVQKVEDNLQEAMKNLYGLETDSGKADMVTGKIVGNYQWSGDAVYAMDQAEEYGTELAYEVPEEGTDLWLDGWVMLKSGINGDAKKKQAAEAFINYLSRPDNAVRNMYYIGYTSSITGGDDDTIFDYIKYCYGVDETDKDAVDYPLGIYFSGDNSDERYILKASSDQLDRQLGAQYPTEEIVGRSSIMGYFDDDANKRINQMWINTRCYDVKDTPVYVWIIITAALAGLIILYIKRTMDKRAYK